MPNRRQLQKYMLDPNHGGVLTTAWMTYQIAHQHHLKPDAIAVFRFNHQCPIEPTPKWTLELGAYGLTEHNDCYETICSAITDIHRDKQIKIFEFNAHANIGEICSMIESGFVYQLWIYHFDGYHYEWQEWQAPTMNKQITEL